MRILAPDVHGGYSLTVTALVPALLTTICCPRFRPWRKAWMVYLTSSGPSGAPDATIWAEMITGVMAVESGAGVIQIACKGATALQSSANTASHAKHVINAGWLAGRRSMIQPSTSRWMRVNSGDWKDGRTAVGTVGWGVC
jgi:hypothetical protein